MSRTMADATPSTPHDRDPNPKVVRSTEDAIYARKPDWLPAEEWEQILAGALDDIHARIVALREEAGR